MGEFEFYDDRFVIVTHDLVCRDFIARYGTTLRPRTYYFSIMGRAYELSIHSVVVSEGDAYIKPKGIGKKP